MDFFPVSYIMKMDFALPSCTLERPAGLPPFLPRTRAAARPAIVRSLMISRSNSAREANTLNVKRPVAVAVFIPSCRLVNPAPRAFIFVTTLGSPYLRFVYPKSHQKSSGCGGRFSVASFLLLITLIFVDKVKLTEGY